MSIGVREAKPGMASIIFALTTSIAFMGGSMHYLSPLVFWLKNSDLLTVAASLTAYSFSYTAAVCMLLKSKERDAVRLVGLAGGLTCTFSLLLLVFGMVTSFLIPIAASLGFSLGILLPTAHRFTSPRLTLLTFLGPLAGVLVIRGRDVDFFLLLFSIAILILSYIMLLPARFVYIPKPSGQFDFNLPKLFIAATLTVACGLSTATLLIPVYVLDVLEADVLLIGIALTGGLLLTALTSSILAKLPPLTALRAMSSFVFVESIVLFGMMYFNNPYVFAPLWIAAFALASALGSFIAALAGGLGGAGKSAAANLIFSFGGALGPLIAGILWVAFTPHLMFGVGVLLYMSSGIVLRHYLAKKLPSTA